jgi:hypothetical protein
MGRKLTLARFVLKPIDTFKKAYKIFNSIDVVPVVRVADKLNAKDTEDGDYVVVGGVAFPAETWKLISPSLMKVDYQYNNGSKCYYFPENQGIYTSVLTKDEITAMHVAKRFQDAS